MHPISPKSKLEFIFDGKFGEVEVCIRWNPTTDPDQKTPCRRWLIVDSSFSSVNNSYHRALFDPSIEKTPVPGVYRVELTGKMNSGLIFGISEVDENGVTMAKEIKAGIPFSEHLSKWTEAVFYTFELSADDAAKSIHIRLSPWKGNYIVAVSRGFDKPSIEQNYWRSESNSVMITVDDPQFKPEGVYTIGVFPKLGSDPSEKKEYRYQIKWTYTNKHSVLIPSLIEYGKLSSTSECFYIGIEPSWEHVLIAKHGQTKNLELFGSIGNIHTKPDYVQNDFRALSHESGLEIKKDEIKKNCAKEFSMHNKCGAYLCLYGNAEESFSLVVIPNNSPVLLLEGQTFMGPVPAADETLKFIYKPTKESSIDIEEFTNSHSVSIEASVYESQEKVVFPKLKTGEGFEQSESLIHVTHDTLAKFKNPIIVISVGKRTSLPASTESKYNFNYWFGIEAGYLIKELVRGTPRRTEIEAGIWKFFYFYNSDLSSSIYVGLDSLNGGDADMFIAKGKDERPTASKYLSKSKGYQSTYLRLSKKTLASKGISGIQGYYVLGVRANSDIRCAITWRTSDSVLKEIHASSKYTSVLRNGKNLNLVFANFFDHDYEFQVDAHHHDAEIYWNSIQMSGSFYENNMDLIPGPKNHKLKFTVRKEDKGKVFVIPKSTPGFCNGCRFFFTIVPLNVKTRAQFEYKLILNGGKTFLPEILNAGDSVVSIMKEKDSRRMVYIVNKQQSEMLSVSALEVISERGKAEITLGVHPQFNSVNNLVRQTVNKGHTSIGLKKLKNDNISRLYVQVDCLEVECNIELNLMEPEKSVILNKNDIHENFMSPVMSVSSYIYRVGGKERFLQIYFEIEDFLDDKVRHLEKKDLEKLITVGFTKDKNQTSQALSTGLVPTYSNHDSSSNRVVFHFKPTKGFIIIKVGPFQESSYKYKIEVNTEHVSSISAGRPSVGYIGAGAGDHVYEFISTEPGAVFLKYSKCFGETSDLKVRLDEEMEENRITLDGERFTQIADSKTEGSRILLKVEKGLDKQNTNEEFGYLDRNKKAAVFSLEVVEKESFGEIPFDKIKPSSENLIVEFIGKKPKIHFRPLNLFHLNSSQFDVSYHVVVSKDPEVVQYYLNCQSQFLSKVVKRQYKVKEVVQVFSTEMNPTPLKEVIGDQKYLTVSLDISESHKYFANVYAQVHLRKDSRKGNNEKWQNHVVRFKYREVNFEYRSFFFPLELLAASIGLVALFVGSCCIFDWRVGSLFKKVSGFNKVRNNVDEELEDYYMQIKRDFEAEEKEYQGKIQKENPEQEKPQQTNLKENLEIETKNDQKDENEPEEEVIDFEDAERMTELEEREKSKNIKNDSEEEEEN